MPFAPHFLGVPRRELDGLFGLVHACLQLARPFQLGVGGCSITAEKLRGHSPLTVTTLASAASSEMAVAR